MKIKHMRLLLPQRMSGTAHMDARLIAEAAGRALAGAGKIHGPVRVQVQGQGQPAMPISQQVLQQIRRQTQNLKREG